jgi:hypothetical protein
MRISEEHRYLMLRLKNESHRGVTTQILARYMGKTCVLDLVLSELREDDLIEVRFEGKPWPGESQAPDPSPWPPRRRVRLTAKGSKALAQRD